MCQKSRIKDKDYKNFFSKEDSFENDNFFVKKQPFPFNSQPVSSAKEHSLSKKQLKTSNFRAFLQAKIFAKDL